MRNKDALRNPNKDQPLPASSSSSSSMEAPIIKAPSERLATISMSRVISRRKKTKKKTSERKSKGTTRL